MLKLKRSRMELRGQNRRTPRCKLAKPLRFESPSYKYLTCDSMIIIESVSPTIKIAIYAPHPHKYTAFQGPCRALAGDAGGHDGVADGMGTGAKDGSGAYGKWQRAPAE